MSDAGPTFNKRQAVLQLVTARYFVGPYYYFKRHLHVSGRENVPKDRPVVIVSNHRSNWDPPILCVATDKPTCYVAKKELFQNPYLAKLIEFYGSVSIDREKPSLSSIKQIKKAIKAGWSLGVFIEGTRSKVSDSMGEPHTGAAYFALANNLLILPVGLIDTDKPDSKCYARIGKVIEPGVDLETKTWEIMQALADLTGYKLPER